MSHGPATSSTTSVRYVLCQISSAEQEVMREWDIHDARSIKANSAVDLSRKPGLDVCCDLLQHLQGVPRICIYTPKYFEVGGIRKQHPYVLLALQHS